MATILNKLGIQGKQKLFLCLIFFNFLNLFLRQRERVCLSGRGSEREGDTESEASSRFRAISTEPDVGLELVNPRDHDLS